jgi:DNA-binding NarL/FixJ family response regulator
MTRLIFVEDELVMVLEVDLGADELVEVIQSGRWLPPPALTAVFGAQPPPPLRAARLGRLVIVSTAPPHGGAPSAPVEVVLGPDGKPLRDLSPRQVQVLQGLADGLTTKEIARSLGLHVRTVEMHIVAVKRRFGTTSRMQSVLRGVALGLCKVRPELK